MALLQRKKPEYVGTGPRWLNLEAAAAYIGARPWFVSELIRKGTIPHHTVGKGFSIDKLDLDKFMETTKVL
jgi:excisionase family DNA binding protein